MLLALLAGLQNALGGAPPPPVVLTPIPVAGLVTGVGEVEGWTDNATISFGVVRRRSVYGAFLLDSLTLPSSGAPAQCPRPALPAVTPCSRPAQLAVVACPRPVNN